MLELLLADCGPPRVRDWWTLVGSLGCVITGRPSPTLHHIHSGSVALGGFVRGGGQKLNDYLVIPLDASLHTAGPDAIDGGIGVFTWEAKFGDQVGLMDLVCRLTGVNAWQLAGYDRDPWALD